MSKVTLVFEDFCALNASTYNVQTQGDMSLVMGRMFRHMHNKERIFISMPVPIESTPEFRFRITDLVIPKVSPDVASNIYKWYTYRWFHSCDDFVDALANLNNNEMLLLSSDYCVTIIHSTTLGHPVA